MSVPILTCSMLPTRSGAPDARLIVLGPSLGTTSTLWDLVALGLSADYRVLRFDLPGHGFSPAATASFSVAELADGVINLVDSVGGGSFIYAGDSLGAAVGFPLARRHPERVQALVAFCAPARFGTPDGWVERAVTVRASGTAAVVSSSAARWFAPDYLQRDPGRGATALDQLLEVDDESYALCCEALAAYDFTAEAPSLSVPTLLVAGELDIATPPEDVRSLAGLIPAARYAVIAGAAHLPVMELPDRAEQLIRSMIPSTVSQRDQNPVTLPRLIADGHENEIALYIRAALADGLTREEVSEAIMHTSLYAGLPAANSAFAIAREVFAILDSASDGETHG